MLSDLRKCLVTFNLSGRARVRPAKFSIMEEDYEPWLVSNSKAVPKLLLNVFLQYLLDCISCVLASEFMA